MLKRWRCKLTRFGKCKFCGEEKELIKAHIIPRNFYLYRKQDKYRAIDSVTGKGRQIQSGIYDTEILCKDCDGKILKLFDDEAYRVLLNNNNFIKSISQKANSKVYKLDSSQFNYSLLRKFFISVLWRASVSNISDFQSINLGKYENIALEIMKDINMHDNLFKILVFKSPEKAKYNGIVYLRHGRFYSTHIYRLVLGQFEIAIFPNCSSFGSNIYNLYDKIFMSRENLYVLEDETIYQEKINQLKSFVKNWKN